MKKIFIYAFIAISISSCIFNGQLDDCFRYYTFDFPMSIYPVNDTLNVGDTLWVEINLDNFFIMKKIYTLLLLFISLNFVYGQERFFEFTEGWKSSVTIEYDTHYTIVGTGHTPDYYNNVLFTKINKSGDYLSSWNIVLDSAVSTQMISQQALSCYNNDKIMGVTIKTESDLLLRAKRLHLNNDMTQVLDSSWEYIAPNDNQSVMFITLQVDDNTILHSTDRYNGIGNFQSTLVSTDTLGNLKWERLFSCSGRCVMRPRHIVPAHDGGYIFTNNEIRLFEGNVINDHNVGTIIKTDSLGIEQWRIYPGGVGFPFTSEFIILIPTDDGNYLCAWADNSMRTGTSTIAYNTNPDATIWFAKIDPQGNKLWEKNIQEEMYLRGLTEPFHLLYQMIKLSDGNIAICSYDKLIKITQDAEVLWARKVKPALLENSGGQTNYMEIYGLTETSDGGFICAGETWIHPGSVFPEYTQTGFILKVDQYGCLEEDCHLNDPVVSVEEAEEKSDILLYPNPVNDYFVVDYSIIQASENISLLVTDINGKIMYNKILETQQDEIIIRTDEFPIGQYFCTLKTNNNTVKTEKFIIVK